ncbi:MAG: hypothetical protein IFNCLDLE_02689 [Ignavibacteriaceae bacterium]|nr:hypothetical protein [Ignavibacteriaceae bacterium]
MPKNIVFFNICREGEKWRLSGRVGDESVSERHDTQKECVTRATEILNAYKYINKEV